MPNLSDDQVMTRLTSEVTQLPIATAKLKLIDTLVDFYEYTLCYQTVLAPIDTVIDQATYTPVIPANYFLVQAMSAQLNSIPLDEMSADTLDLEWPEISRNWNFSSRHDLAFSGLDDPTWRNAKSTQPRFYHFETDGKVRLVGIPQTVYAGATDGLLLRVALKPLLTLTTIDDAVWNDNYQTIVAGCLARLFIMPKKPWSDPKLAIFWGEVYDDGREQRREEILRGDLRSDREVLRSVCYA